MVDLSNIAGSLNMTQLFSAIPGGDTIIQLGKAAIIIIIIYFIFLIIKGLFSLRRSYNIGSMAKNVEEINKKLDVLIGKKGKKK